MNRVIAYIDGFNLYYGLREKYRHKYVWIDLQSLCESLCKSNQILVQAKYFTASVRNNPSKQARQTVFLNALKAHSPELMIVKGRFQEKTTKCLRCNSSWVSYEEKETDVSIAVTIVEDAANNLFDTALIVSADSDLVPAIISARRLRPSGRFIAVFPPARRSGELQKVVNGWITISEAKLRSNLLPDLVSTASGEQLGRPPTWH